MQAKMVVALILGITLTGCPGPGAIDYGKPGTTEVRSFAQGAVENLPGELTNDPIVNSHCELTGPEDFGVSAILIVLAKGAVSIAFDALEQGIKEELETYTTTYDASAQGHLLASDNSQALRCLRIVRFSKENPKQPVAEIVAQVGIVDADDGKVSETVEHPAAFKIRPLRAALCQSPARSDDQQTYGLSASVKVASFWTQDRVGYSSAIEEPYSFLPEAKLELPNPGGDCSEDKNWDVERFVDKEEFKWNNLSPLPLPAGIGTGLGVFEFSVAEAGKKENRGQFLESVQKLFGASKDDLASLVKGAVEAALTEDEEE